MCFSTLSVAQGTRGMTWVRDFGPPVDFWVDCLILWSRTCTRYPSRGETRRGKAQGKERNYKISRRVRYKTNILYT